MISMEQPIYPNSARMMRKFGNGVFWMKFDNNGRVKTIKISRAQSTLTWTMRRFSVLPVAMPAR